MLSVSAVLLSLTASQFVTPVGWSKANTLEPHKAQVTVGVGAIRATKASPNLSGFVYGLIPPSVEASYGVSSFFEVGAQALPGISAFTKLRLLHLPHVGSGLHVALAPSFGAVWLPTSMDMYAGYCRAGNPCPIRPSSNNVVVDVDRLMLRARIPVLVGLSLGRHQIILGGHLLKEMNSFSNGPKDSCFVSGTQEMCLYYPKLPIYRPLFLGASLAVSFQLTELLSIQPQVAVLTDVAHQRWDGYFADEAMAKMLVPTRLYVSVGIKFEP